MTTMIRLATPDDAEQVLAVYAPSCATPTSFEAGPPTLDDMRDRIQRVLLQFPWLVCADNRDIMGYVYASGHRERAAYRWSVDTTVYIQRKRHRQGLGRALYEALFSILRLQGYINAYAGITLPNPASVRIHEALGFEPVGIYRHVGYKCGAWHDVGWYQKLLQPLPPVPEEPKSVLDVYDPRLVESIPIRS